MPEVAYFATQGNTSGDNERIEALLKGVDAHPLDFERGKKLRSGLRLFAALAKRRPALVVMEGTGLGGGLAMIGARLLLGITYVVSSGDAVGPYVAINHRLLAPIAGLYERALCRFSAGYIGWSPYLAGRAISFGAPRAMTAANWAPPGEPEHRGPCREKLGISDDAIVFGIVGSLEWTGSVAYCYGSELVRAVLESDRQDVRVLIVGDGSGVKHLEELAGEDLGRRILLPGRIPRDQVPAYLAAMDVASLPQSVDGVGSFRYTTKISEYLSAGLPVVTGQIPLAYDLDDGWIWRLPGDAPWDGRYISALARLMAGLSVEELAERRRAVPRDLPLFDLERQQSQVAEFITDLLESRYSSR
jgi:glycosyltransferase involved in cell wall biosynthesis